MAQKITTFTFCDFPHRGKEVPANDTAHLSVDGRHFEVDLCEQHQVQVGKMVSQMTEHARTMKEPWKSNGHRPQGKRSNGGNGQPSVDNAAVRAWAAERQIEVSARGQLPRRVIEQYQESQAS